MLRAIGADQVIDYTQEAFTKRGKTYDLILDLVSKSSFSGSVKSLKGGGRYLIANPGLSHMIQGRWISMTRGLIRRLAGKQVIFGAAYPKTEDLLFLKGLIEAGKMKSVIDRRYPLEETAEAHRYVETGHKKGHVIITVANQNKT
jgi:NADPH:quinone reductase-like Zn-dependent oxidoreductase